MLKTIIKSCGVLFAGIVFIYIFIEAFWFFNQASDIAIGIGIIIEIALLGFLIYIMALGVRGILKTIGKETDNDSR